MIRDTSHRIRPDRRSAIGFHDFCKDASVTGRIGIGPREPSGFGIAVEPDVSLQGIDRAVPQDLIDTAHRDICPYSHATRGNVDVKIARV